MRFACWITKATDTLRMYNIYCFPTATMVTRTRLNVMFIFTGPVLLRMDPRPLTEGKAWIKNNGHQLSDIVKNKFFWLMQIIQRKFSKYCVQCLMEGFVSIQYISSAYCVL
jgi:hypothetical protein